MSKPFLYYERTTEIAVKIKIVANTDVFTVSSITLYDRDHHGIVCCVYSLILYISFSFHVCTIQYYFCYHNYGTKLLICSCIYFSTGILWPTVRALLVF